MGDSRATGYSNINIFRFLYKTFAEVTRQKIISQYISLGKKVVLYVSILLCVQNQNDVPIHSAQH